MVTRELIDALRKGDEGEVGLELNLLSRIPRGSWWLHPITREEAMRLVERGGTAARVALSEHFDGRVREAALRALRPDEGATLGALLRRANDWVPTIARLAGERATGALRTASDDELADALPLVFALTRQSRVAHGLLLGAYRDEVARRGRLARRLRLANRNGELGRWAFHNLAGEGDTPETIAREGIREASPAVQIDAARRLAKDPSVWPLLMASGNPVVRRLGLDVAPGEAREAALTDPHAGVRNDARYLLGSRDYAAHYRSRLPEPGALSGLGETGTPDDASLLRPLVQHNRADVRRRAIEALARLIGNDAEPELRAALCDPSRKVQRAAVEALGRTTIGFDAEAVASMDLGPQAAWAMMDRTPRWAGLVAVLRHAETFPRAEAWLDRWPRAQRFAPPRGGESAIARELLEANAERFDPATADRLRRAILP